MTTTDHRGGGPDPATGGPADDLPGPVLTAFSAGSLDALGLVYDRYHRQVATVVSRTVGATGVRDDAVQEVFLRAWRSSANYNPDRPLGPWLFTIARRTAIDVLRREMRRTRGDHDQYQDRPTSGIDEVALWQAWEVRQAIDRLPIEEAVVVRLAHLHGLTHREIADEIGVPLGTVKSRSHRAHRRLATLLGHLAPIVD